MFDQLKTFLNGDSAVEALKAEFGLDTILAARTGLALTVPTMVANYANWLADPASANWIRTTIPTIRPDSLADFNTLTGAADYRDIGEHSLDVVLGGRRSEVVTLVAARAELPEAAAYGLLSATTWVLTVAISRFHGASPREEIAEAFAVEHAKLLEAGWEPWLRTAAPASSASTLATTTGSFLPVPMVGSSLVDTGQHQITPPPAAYAGATGNAAGSDVAARAPRPDDRDSLLALDSRPGGSGDRLWVYVAGVLGTLLVLSLVVGSFLLGRLQDSADSEQIAAQVPAQDSAVEEEGDAAQVEGGETANAGDGQSIDSNSPDSPDALSDTDADTEAEDAWPGGRGPVPDAPPNRRTLEIKPDGTPVLSGSAPTWELAMQVLQVAERNYPVEGVEISNELTWHPEAASSVRSGDAVIPQAATFPTGSSELSPESLAALDLAVSILNSSPSVYVVVTGHTDEVGDEAVNVSLSSDRVDATVDYLINAGVIPGQIVTAAAGEDDPTASNDTDDGRQSNRRVELLFKNFLAPPLGDGS